MELERAVVKFASQLEQLGYKKGDHLALIDGNSPYYIIGLYGALRMGATVIPINPLYTPHEMTYILRNGVVIVIITMDVLMEMMVAIYDQLPNVNSLFFCGTQC